MALSATRNCSRKAVRPADQQWDAIVIGSGLGGLTTAAYLAANGRRTLVLEQYDVIGGCTHVFRRAGEWEFEVGVHFLSDCGPGGQIPTMLRGLGLDRHVEFLPMDADGFDTLTFPELTFRVPFGWDNYLNRLIETFPEQEREIRRCVGTLRRIGRAVDRSTSPASLAGAAKLALRCGLDARWLMRPLDVFLKSHDLSLQARSVIGAQWGTYACPPHRTPVVLHAGHLDDLIEGRAWYPRGGGQVLSATLAQLITANGGQLRTRAKVDRILVSAGAVTGVRLTDGQEITAPVVVSNADLKRTYLDLVGREHLRPRTVRRVTDYRMAAPFSTVYLGLDIDLRDRMSNTNIYVFPAVEDPDALVEELEELAGRDRASWVRQAMNRLLVYINSPTVKDPDNPRSAPPGYSTLEVVTWMPADYDFWGLAAGPASGTHYSRNPEYLAIKDQLIELAVQRLAKALPGAERHIVFTEASTPITHERYTLSSHGSALGIESSVGQFGPLRPKSRTEIGGLYLAGASLAWGPGVEGVMLSGLHAAGAVLGRKLDAEIRAGAVFGDRVALPAHRPNWDPLAAARQLAVRTRRAPQGTGS